MYTLGTTKWLIIRGLIIKGVAVDKRNLFDILVKWVREIRHFTETELTCSADSYTYALPKGIERVEKWYRRTLRPNELYYIISSNII